MDRLGSSHSSRSSRNSRGRLTRKGCGAGTKGGKVQGDQAEVSARSDGRAPPLDGSGERECVFHLKRAALLLLSLQMAASRTGMRACASMCNKADAAFPLAAHPLDAH